MNFNPATNKQTRDQMMAVIFLSCVKQTNAENHPDEPSYHRALLARFRSRTAEDGQQELPV